ncbi:type II secretion system minor pseudopilin GspI [Psychrosphaera haliotis]|uniref:Type II secretion system protein I n=1 Tax=Psychrosphaera haliotis TaxID=555083 RepID=A0A6N8FEL9_9GAMM|nr:type II secretion system minor pseudopilin GspI [Psychrosphaera haliotis]MUH73430.1 type II secretion system protein GspI [Psychrosphaera haliotis]
MKLLTPPNTVPTAPLNRLPITTRKKVNGFTLVEMLLALAIFAYASASILNVVSQSASNIGLLQQMTFASWVAQNRLTELQVETTWPPKQNHKGEAEMAGLKWFWRQQVVETADPRMRAVTVSVYEFEDSKSSIYDLETYVVQYEPRGKSDD